MKSFSVLILAAFAVILAGCATSTSTNPGATSMIVRPGVGSMFVYRRLAWDTVGVLVENTLDTLVVLKSGITYDGKNNAIMVSSPGDTALRNASYYDYEPNGDFDDYSAIPGVHQGWRTYPIASKGSSTFVQVDSNYFDSTLGRQVHWYRKFVMTYVKDSTIVEDGRSYHASQIHFEAGDETNFQDFTTYDWIDRSIGFIVRSTTTLGRPYPQSYSAWESHLISYVLK